MAMVPSARDIFETDPSPAHSMVSNSFDMNSTFIAFVGRVSTEKVPVVALYMEDPASASITCHGCASWIFHVKRHNRRCTAETAVAGGVQAVVDGIGGVGAGGGRLFVHAVAPHGHVGASTGHMVGSVPVGGSGKHCARCCVKCI